MATIQTGVNTPGTANVDTNFNLAIVTPSADKTGFVNLSVQDDDGVLAGTSVVGVPRVSKLATSRNRTLRVGSWLQEFCSTFAMAAQNTSIWLANVGSGTFAHTNGWLVFNNSSITSAGVAIMYRTWRQFVITPDVPKIIDVDLMISAAPPTNWNFEFGIGIHNGGTPFAPTDGAWVRINTSGVFLVSGINGAETLGGSVYPAASIPVAVSRQWRLVVHVDSIEVWLADADGDYSLLGTLATPATAAGISQAMSGSFFARLNQPAIASAAVQMRLGSVVVWSADNQTTKLHSYVQAAAGLHSSQAPDGTTAGQTGNMTNNLAVGAGAVATNTTAAVSTGLGGQFTVQPALAAGTDGIMQSFQNQTGAVGSPGRTLMVTGVRLRGIVTTVLVGGPVSYVWSVAFGHTAVTLTTAETSVAKAPRRMPLDIESFAAAAAVGTLGQLMDQKFEPPIPVNPGELFALVAKNVGTVTSTGAITYIAQVQGYWTD